MNLSVASDRKLKLTKIMKDRVEGRSLEGRGTKGIRFQSDIALSSFTVPSAAHFHGSRRSAVQKRFRAPFSSSPEEE